MEGKLLATTPGMYLTQNDAKSIFVEPTVRTSKEISPRARPARGFVHPMVLCGRGDFPISRQVSVDGGLFVEGIWLVTCN